MEQKECSFDKIGCTRERKRKPLSFLLPFHSFALSLNNIGCTREWQKKNFVFSFAIPLICTIFE